jgi:ABC-type multidrug transport system ATPase subunit
MLALARGLISKPKLLLIDEMSQGLAPTIVANLFDIVAGFPNLGVSVLLVEQFVGQALGVASRAYVLDKGEVGFEGAAATLASDESFVQGSYLGDIEADEVSQESAERGSRSRSAAVSGTTSPAEGVRVSLPPALLRSLEEQARAAGVDPQALVQEMIEARLAERTARPAPTDKTTAAKNRRGATPSAKSAGKRSGAKSAATKKATATTAAGNGPAATQASPPAKRRARKSRG